MRENVKLSAAMVDAIVGSFPDGTLSGASRPTARALVRRGLADEVFGKTQVRNRYSRTFQTVYHTYLGTRLNEAGLALREELLGEDET